MRIAIIGANGRTGHLATEQALDRGHDVVAVARQPHNVTTQHERLTVRPADVMDEQALRAALAGTDVVISTLGIGTSRKPTTVYSVGVRKILNAMHSRTIQRLAVISAAPVGPRSDHPGLEHKIVLPILEALFGETYEDMREMKRILQASTADWVALRPPRLLAKPALGSYRIGPTPPPGGRSLRYGDLATALLDAIEDPRLSKTAQYVSN
ncbi:putative NADH-flavin reductase [Branchiibius hedensis]|uniref:NADH-flavin reductase n=1 Tax=Branchiibius hedensis TaxID=672460 RepID=A0A2Y8ZP29_9MICO|nr:SDR family oxidoreductase [Branchiibius hedensis]PWJ24869.1 putative NADH-flavin reductase [Branchiibius hedensis]SSA33685.1 Putative NADH-flavin reductase [Branchiibius hedensis]